MTLTASSELSSRRPPRGVLVGRVRIQSHASDTMSSSAGFSGTQPSSARMRSLDATRTGGSPARRGDSTAGIWQPVTSRAASTTSRTENPLPLPRLKMR